MSRASSFVEEFNKDRGASDLSERIRKAAVQTYPHRGGALYAVTYLFPDGSAVHVESVHPPTYAHPVESVTEVFPVERPTLVCNTDAGLAVFLASPPSWQEVVMPWTDHGDI